MTILSIFKRSERNIRSLLSRHPVLYGFVGGVGIVLFWRGIWHTADFVALLVLARQGGTPTIDYANIWDSLISLGAGSLLLLSTGLFVSDLIGSEMLAAGLKGEKKLAEETESDIERERRKLAEMEGKLEHLDSHLEKIEEKIDRNFQ